MQAVKVTGNIDDEDWVTVTLTLPTETGFTFKFTSRGAYVAPPTLGEDYAAYVKRVDVDDQLELVSEPDYGFAIQLLKMNSANKIVGFGQAYVSLVGGTVTLSSPKLAAPKGE